MGEKLDCEVLKGRPANPVRAASAERPGLEGQSVLKARAAGRDDED
jgi:hypothetical protein